MMGKVVSWVRTPREDTLVEEMTGNIAANLIVVHGDAAVFIRFSIEQDHRAGNMDGIEIIHVLVGHISDDDAVEEFILHGFELFLELVNFIRDEQLNELFYSVS